MRDGEDVVRDFGSVTMLAAILQASSASLQLLSFFLTDECCPEFLFPDF